MAARPALGVAHALIPDGVDAHLDHVGQAAPEHLAQRHLPHVFVGGRKTQGGEQGSAEGLGGLASPLIQLDVGEVQGLQRACQAAPVHAVVDAAAISRVAQAVEQLVDGDRDVGPAIEGRVVGHFEEQVHHMRGKLAHESAATSSTTPSSAR